MIPTDLSDFINWEPLKPNIPLFRREKNKEQALAAYDSHGNPICGHCETIVGENQINCNNCGYKLYTYKGRLTRIPAAVFGFASTIAPITTGRIYFIVMTPIGILLLYIWIQLRRDRPLRDLKLKEKVPYVAPSQN